MFEEFPVAVEEIWGGEDLVGHVVLDAAEEDGGFGEVVAGDADDGGVHAAGFGEGAVARFGDDAATEGHEIDGAIVGIGDFQEVGEVGGLAIEGDELPVGEALQGWVGDLIES